MGNNVKVLNERIEEIITLIAEVANGNFNYKIDTSETGDELDAVISGVSMLGQELKNSTVSKNFMTSIYHGVVDMLLILDTDFKIRIVNKALEESLGYKEDELKGVQLAHLIHKKDNPNFSKFMSQFEKKGKYVNAEAVLTTKRGNKIPASCSFSYLTNNQKETDGILIIAKDISQLKQTENELKEAKNKAEAANDAKSNFLSSMSHEIRTPLNGIMGFTDLLMETPLTDSQRKYLDLIKTSGATLTKLLNDILDLNKIEQDKIVLEMTPFDFRKTISANLQPYKHLAESKNLSFANTFDESIPQLVLGDPDRLNQVLVNLVSNAIKFTHEGDIHVHHKVQFIEKDDLLVLTCSVTDTGIGIPKEKQREIFDSFTQADNSNTRKYGGWGLGLTISKKLVNLMQGELGVVSPPPDKESGSVFWFSVKLKPVEKESKSAEKSTIPPGYKLREGIQILLVDDNEMNMVLMQDMLESFGAIVTTAQDGKEAVEKALHKSYDLVFMDIQMPVMDGIEATMQLRKSDFTIPIIAFSANAYKDDIHKSFDAGMNDYLCKPFTREELIALLEKWT